MGEQLEEPAMYVLKGTHVFVSQMSSWGAATVLHDYDLLSNSLELWPSWIVLWYMYTKNEADPGQPCHQ